MAIGKKALMARGSLQVILCTLWCSDAPQITSSWNVLYNYHSPTNLSCVENEYRVGYVMAFCLVCFKQLLLLIIILFWSRKVTKHSILSNMRLRCSKCTLERTMDLHAFCWNIQIHYMSGYTSKWTLNKPKHLPDSWPLTKTCKAWPAEFTVRTGYSPFFKNPSFWPIVTLKWNRGERKEIYMYIYI